MTTGLEFPLKVNEGNLVTASGVDLIASQIRHILLTFKGEILMRGDYGTAIALFGSEQFGRVQRGILKELRKRLPAIQFQVIVSQQDDGNLMATVLWDSQSLEVRLTNG